MNRNLGQQDEFISCGKRRIKIKWISYTNMEIESRTKYRVAEIESAQRKCKCELVLPTIRTMKPASHNKERDESTCLKSGGILHVTSGKVRLSSINTSLLL